MKMTLHTDYALRMLIYVATSSADTCTVADVAEAYGLSHHHLLKVAQSLRDLGLIETVRGRAGGIRLIAQPERINVGTVVRAMEGDLAVVECLGAGGRCVISPACGLKGVFAKAVAAYLAVLDSHMLSDVMSNGPALRDLLGLEAA